MPCYRPMFGSRSVHETKKGKRKIVFSSAVARRYSLDGSLGTDGIMLPCGQCIGCRLERSRQWAMRCMHEASLYSDNCFLTLTYAPEHLPEDRSLKKFHFQNFMKRLRKRFGSGVRYYHCGEYGEKFARPHYHACLFNFDFKDKVLYKMIEGRNLYVSESLSDLWPFGFASIGSVTFQSAAYVARYILKKVLGKDADDHYAGREPEYTTMSRRPGIAAAWIQSYMKDVYPHDFVVVNGKKVKPSKYYDSAFEVAYPDDYERVKERRLKDVEKRSVDNTLKRLSVKERKKFMDVKLLVRGFERGDL